MLKQSESYNPILWQAAKNVARRKNNPYQIEPARFAREVLNAQPTMYQSEILNSIIRYRRVAVRGPHGLGKTAMAAWAVLWFLSSYEDAKVVTTASAWRQLTKYLWPEIHKWARKARDLGLELLSLSIKAPTGEAFAVASDNPDLIEGAHASHLLYVFDEAKAIPDATWNAAEGAFASGDCYALAISTPGDRSGRFYEIHRKAKGLENWHTRHVSLDEAIAAGRVNQEWVDQQLKQWGPNNPEYQARVLGEFPEQTEDSLINLAWVEAARQRELEPGEHPFAGLDVARSGADDSALVITRGDCVIGIDIWHGQDTMETTGRVIMHGVPTNVDVIGVGAGVYDRLREQDFRCMDINVGSAAVDKEHFKNLRSEIFWTLRERFRAGKVDLTRLDDESYDRLCGELTALKFFYTSKGQIQLEDKDEMKKRLGHSPDLADALALAFAPGVRTAGLGKDAETPKHPSRFSTLTGGSRWRR